MQNELIFCKGWFGANKIAVDIWPVEKAKKAHKAGKKYTVLVGSQERPSCVLLVDRSMKYIGVTFLDHLLRRFVHYSFSEEVLGRLWFNSAIRYDYADETDDGYCITGYNFAAEHGRVVVRIDQSPELKVYDGGPYDISIHEVQWPEFGEYEELIKGDRVSWNVKSVGPVRINSTEV